MIHVQIVIYGHVSVMKPWWDRIQETVKHKKRRRITIGDQSVEIHRMTPDTKEEDEEYVHASVEFTRAYGTADQLVNEIETFQSQLQRYDVDCVYCLQDEEHDVYINTDETGYFINVRYKVVVHDKAHYMSDWASVVNYTRVTQRNEAYVPMTTQGLQNEYEKQTGKPIVIQKYALR